MTRKPVSTNLDPELMKRVEAIAKGDRRSLANVIELCVERGLPFVEAALGHRTHGITNSKPVSAGARTSRKVAAD